ncbi:MAG: hypothetical protein Rubg2KO_22950 [Rubricoccaceae bacterium]
MTDTTYTPIACEYHDRLESWAVRRQPVEVVWAEGDTERRELAVIADVFARDGADWIRLATGDVVRADALVSVDGLPLPDAC